MDKAMSTFGQEPPVRRSLRRRWAVCACVLGLLALLTAGFFLFLARIPTAPVALNAPAEAIVVLTGGKYRVSQSLRLLRASPGARLLISGVHPETSLDQLISLAPGKQALLRCCVDLGRAATSTVGNAWEARRWVERGGYQSIVLVTSNYHMPRSLMELRRALPRVRIHPWPVMHEGVSVGNWWHEADTARLLFGEYLKFLGAAMRSLMHPTLNEASALPLAPALADG